MKSLNKISSWFTPKPDSVIHSRLVLYFVFFLAISNLYMNLVAGDIWFFIYFGLVAFVTSFFNKNMVVVLFFAIIFTNVLKYGVYEGFVGKEAEMEGFTDEKKDESFAINIPNQPANAPATAPVPVPKEDPKPEQKDIPKPGLKIPITTPDPKLSDAEQKALNKLKGQAEDLLSAQQQILGGFEKISPHMDRAEKLIKQINSTAETLQNMGN